MRIEIKNLNDTEGKYDDLAFAAMMSTKAEGALVVILNGEKGSGFSICAVGNQAARDILSALQNILNDVIAQANDTIKKHEL
jgi:hypothetical protein